MNAISIDATLADKLNEGMGASGKVELPFPVLYAWVLNGQSAYKSQGGALYYGGWACKAEDMEALAKNAGVFIPENWHPAAIATKDGGEFAAYITRFVVIAPIGKRISWLFNDRRYPEYTEGGRQHVQVLTIMATKNEKDEYVPWLPAVLTAKGYQARNLLDVFSRWDKATAGLRYRLSPGVPAWCFYLALGTFGKDRAVINVGKSGVQSPITPISVYLPEEMTEDKLAPLFVGNDTVRRMVEYQEQAQEWLKAWRQPSLEQQPATAAAEENGGFVPENFPEDPLF